MQNGAKKRQSAAQMFDGAPKLCAMRGFAVIGSTTAKIFFSP
jgi:hypothetical protein